jgi:hypothetical protein
VLRDGDGMRKALQTIMTSGTRESHSVRFDNVHHHGETDRCLRAQPHRKPRRAFPHRLSGRAGGRNLADALVTTLDQADKPLFPTLLEG